MNTLTHSCLASSPTAPHKAVFDKVKLRIAKSDGYRSVPAVLPPSAQVGGLLFPKTLNSFVFRDPAHFWLFSCSLATPSQFYL